MIFKTAWFYVFSILFILGVLALGYFIPRTSFYTVLLVYAGLFIIYCIFYKYFGSSKNIKNLLFLGIIVRLLLLISLPQWSDDYVRFVWDGKLLSEGYNPYLLKPSETLDKWHLGSDKLMDRLYPQLNSPHYHSVYPPSNQVAFALAVWLAGDNLLQAVMGIRLFLIGFELLAFYLIIQLLKMLNLSQKRVVLYAINPLVIIEITGNLHFEGMMLTLLLGGIYLLIKGKYTLSGSLLGAAVAVKLSPMMLVPAFIKWLPKNGVTNFLIGGLFLVLVGLVPLFWGNAFAGFIKSLSLYGGRFEFNASAYYLLREFGYWIYGYNIIAFLGPILKGITLVVIIGISLRIKKGEIKPLFNSILLVYWAYFLLNTVIHPWYILPALALSLFTDKKAFLVWSLLIFLSYHAYQSYPYHEKTWILGLEYLGVLFALLWDYRAGYRKTLSR